MKLHYTVIVPVDETKPITSSELQKDGKMIATTDKHTRVTVEPNGTDQYLYYTVKVISLESNRIKTSFTVTKGELEALITALVMLKSELT